jgi:hypothetical protein
MESHKLIVKFFAQDPSAVAQHEFVPVFHGLIQSKAIPDHLLIDVSDYAHVHHGPGVLLAAHEGNFYSDTGEGRLGLLYQRKQPVPDTNGLRDRLAHVFATALRACDILERDGAFGGRLRFRTDEVVLRVNDRLLAPNTPETYRDVEPVLRSFLSELYPGDEVKLEPRHSPLTLFEVRAKASSSPPVSELLERLEALSPSPAAPVPSP